MERDLVAPRRQMKPFLYLAVLFSESKSRLIARISCKEQHYCLTCSVLTSKLRRRDAEAITRRRDREHPAVLSPGARSRFPRYFLRHPTSPPETCSEDGRCSP